MDFVEYMKDASPQDWIDKMANTPFKFVESDIKIRERKDKALSIAAAHAGKNATTAEILQDADKILNWINR